MRLRIGGRSAAAVAVLIATAAYAQSSSAWRFWNKSDGFEESYIRAVSLDSQGRVWVRHGAVPRMSVLDGYSVTALPEPRVGPVESWAFHTRVYASPSGTAWAVENRSLKRFDGREWRVEVEGGSGARMLAAIPWQDDRVLVLFTDRLCEYRPAGRSLKVIQPPSGPAMRKFFKMTAGVPGEAWIVGDAGLARVRVAGNGVEWIELRSGPIGIADPDYPLSSKEGEVFFAATVRHTG